MRSTPRSERIHIGFFGIRNSGKSSIINAIANQEVSVVSNVLGTTTDCVKKAMELQPIGPVILIDTPGIDDEGTLGKKRVEQTKKILRLADVAVLVTEAGRVLLEDEKLLIKEFEERNIPYIIVKNKVDLFSDKEGIVVSAKTKAGIENLKEEIIKLIKSRKQKEIRLVSDFIKEKDVVILVTPIDKGAPKDRLILPQQMAIKDIVDKNAIPIICQIDELEKTLAILKEKPKLVITDSQCFKEVEKKVPKEISLTSFSILMARYKGFLNQALEGSKMISKLEDNSKILIVEGCTHHRQCDDIGTVKIPKLLREKTNKKLDFSFSSGMDFPEKIEQYDLIIHCGGCMLNDKEMEYRQFKAKKKNVPFTNYGMVLAYLNKVLDRAIELFNFT